MITTPSNYQQLFLRIALSTALLSAVADRLGLWDNNATWGDWEHFEAYTRQLTFFLPRSISTMNAYVATILETGFGILLLLGFKTRIVANLTGILLLIFAISMCISVGIKPTLDYSVWVGSAGAFLLGQQQDFRFSLDHFVKNKMHQ